MIIYIQLERIDGEITDAEGMEIAEQMVALMQPLGINGSLRGLKK